MRVFSIFVFFLLLAVNALAGDDGVSIADFEGNDFGAWKVEGAAFGKAPAEGSLKISDKAVTGWVGRGYASSAVGGGEAVGTLTSPPFEIRNKYIELLVGGGFYPETACVRLLIGDETVWSATGVSRTEGDSNHLALEVWDVRPYQGKKARIQILDRAKGRWGHILIDQIRQCDEPSVPLFANPNINRPMASVMAAARVLPSDASRPVYHFLPPANWMNDPNGTIYRNGWYHLFYQHNPYGDRWGHMHWGHARSRDMVTWEHLPIALWPSKSEGEDHIYSGCATVDGEGRTLAFYTSVGEGRPNEQWMGIATDDALRVWRKAPNNPIMKPGGQGDPVWGDGWRDPFIFETEGRTFLIIGADQEERAIIPIYEAENKELSKWNYRGNLIEWPKSEIPYPECPNFHLVGDQWFLSVSPYGPVRYFLGDLDLDRYQFTPKKSGRLVYGGSSFYAPNSLVDEEGRRLLFGWIRGFNAPRGWNGCLAIPRVLSLDEQGNLLQTPVEAIEKLRGRRIQFPTVTIQRQALPLSNVRAIDLEMRLRLKPVDARRCGVSLHRAANGKPAAEIAWEGGRIDFFGESIPMDLKKSDGLLDLRIFIDRTVVELFETSGRMSAVKVLDAPIEPGGIQVFAHGGAAQVLGMDVWPMQAIWARPSERN